MDLVAFVDDVTMHLAANRVSIRGTSLCIHFRQEAKTGRWSVERIANETESLCTWFIGGEGYYRYAAQPP